ncbi:hypothetical protein BT96DRAFT_1021182 [Gymnopus androsaceus JB14]|uniref:Uncharacterized protein n=1 Tax=Gymnopus androsaceus JB14 TaxID=1447944 RepID=A0A6A4HGP8_9AGAR|nr:hypothetical protein BT96DRAFT_1021182 [Gymnopus androsaceus JB14]
MIRAFHHNNIPGDPSLSVDSLRSAPVEEFAALGYHVRQLAEGEDYEEEAKKLAQRLGYPLTEDSKIVWGFKPSANPLVQEWTGELLSKESLQPNADAPTAKCLIHVLDFLALVLSGTALLDFEDPLSKSWIRAELSPGMLWHVPGGSLLSFFKTSESYEVLMLFKGAPSSLIWDKAAESHPARQEYLKGLGL